MDQHNTHVSVCMLTSTPLVRPHVCLHAHALACQLTHPCAIPWSLIGTLARPCVHARAPPCTLPPSPIIPWNSIAVTKKGLGHDMVLMQHQGCLRWVTNVWDKQVMGIMPWHVIAPSRVLDASIVLLQ